MPQDKARSTNKLKLATYGGRDTYIEACTIIVRCAGLPFSAWSSGATTHSSTHCFLSLSLNLVEKVGAYNKIQNNLMLTLQQLPLCSDIQRFAGCLSI